MAIENIAISMDDLIANGANDECTLDNTVAKDRDTLITTKAYDKNRLKEAFFERDITAFHECLSKKISPDFLLNDIFGTYGCFEFAKDILEYYFEDWRTNHMEKTFLLSQLANISILHDPVQFGNAIRSKDPRILELFLPIDMETMKSADPLNTLANEINNDNADDVIKCMEMLLEHWAPTTIPDNQNTFWHIMLNTELEFNLKKDIITKLAKYQQFNDEDKIAILQIFGNFEFPEEVHSDIFEKLYTMIAENRRNEFETNFRQYQSTMPEYHKTQLLFYAIEQCNDEILEFLLSNHVNCKRINEFKLTYLDWAIKNFNSYAIQKFFEKEDLQNENQSNQKITSDLRDDFLHQQSKKMSIFNLVEIFEKSVKNVEYFKYCKCLDELTANNQIDINAPIDKFNNTILHRSEHYWKRTQEELLLRGASIAAKNNRNKLAVSVVQPEALLTHFDNCVELKEEDDFLIRLKSTFWHNTRQMEIVDAIGKTEEIKHLLDHPLITILMHYKWSQLKNVYYLKFFLYMLSIASLLTYTYLIFDHRQSIEVIGIFRILSIISICYLISWELMQIYAKFSKSSTENFRQRIFAIYQKYIKSFTNCCDWIIITMSILLCCGKVEKIVAVLNVMAITWGLFQLFGSLPVLSMSTRIHMLKVVALSFMKHLIPYSIFLGSFSLCFYIIIGSDMQENPELNNFPNLGMAFVKTTVMMTGELDAANLKLPSTYYYVFLFIFVCIMTIVLYNLLNGSAISDILETEKQAIQNEVIYRAKLISRYDRIATEHWQFLKYIVNFKFFYYLKQIVNICKDQRSDSYYCLVNIEHCIESFSYEHNRKSKFQCTLIHCNETVIELTTEQKFFLDQKEIEDVMRLLKERKKKSTFRAMIPLEERLAKAEQRQRAIGNRCFNIEKRLENIENRYTNIERRYTEMEQCYKDMEKRLKACEKQMTQRK